MALGDPSKPLFPTSPAKGGSPLAGLGKALSKKGSAPDPLAGSPFPLIVPKAAAPKAAGRTNRSAAFAGTGQDTAAKKAPAKTKPVVVKRTPAPAKRTPAVVSTTPATSTAPTPTLPPTTEKPTKQTPARRPATAPAQTAGGYANLTPAQIVQQLQAGQYAALDTQDRARTAALTNFTHAVLAQLQGGPAQVGGYYDQAANATNQFAQNAAAGLSAANPNQQDQQLLAAINAPDAQRAQVQNQLANVFGGGAAVLYDRGGAIPGSALEANKAAAQTYAGTLPAITALNGQQGLRSLLAGSDVARGQLRAQAPALQLQIQQANADAALKQAALDQNAQALHLKTQQQDFGNQVTIKRLSQTDARLQLDQARTDHQFQMDAASLNLRSRGQQLAYIKAVNAQTAGKRWLGYGSSTYATLYKRGGAAAEAMKNGVKDKNGNQVAPPLPFWDAVSHMQENGIPEPMAITILSRTYQPGQQGRPNGGLFPLLRSRGYGYAATALGVWTPRRRK